MDAIIALTLLSTLIALRVHVEPTSKVFLYSILVALNENLAYAMWSLKPHNVFAQNRMRSDFELPGSCHAAGPLSIWTSSVCIYKGLVEPKGPVEVAVAEVNSSNQKVDEESCIQVKSMKFDVMPLEVSLRDDPSIRGICQEFAGTEAQNFIKKEVPSRWNSEHGTKRVSVPGSL